MRCHYSAAVLGAGPAGAFCARELALRGHSVALIDRGPSSHPRPIECCSPSLTRILSESRLGEIPASACRPQNSFRSRWGGALPETRDFLFWQTSPGHVLDRKSFDEWLRSAAREAGATLIEPCKVLAVEESAGGWRIKVLRESARDELETRFIVDAMGRTSRSARAPTAGRHDVDKLVCLFSEYALQEQEPFDATVESAPDGWWYAACALDRCQVAYFTDADLLGSPRGLAQGFHARLSTTASMCQFARRLELQPVRATDARTSIRKLLWRGNWLAVGDSAWTLDPLSGNGVERALASARRAATAVSSALIGDTSEALEGFALDTIIAFQRALAQRREYYAAERRWSDREFWRRRFAEPLIEMDSNAHLRPASRLSHRNLPSTPIS